MKVSIALLVVAALVSGGLYAGEVEGLYGPAPENELSHAGEFLETRLGANLVSESVELVDSGFVGTRNDISGYWAAYRFNPPSMPGAVVNFLLERDILKRSWACTNGVLPKCVDDNELCELTVSSDEVLRLAEKSGFIVEGVEYDVVLGIYAGVDGFSWRVSPMVKRGTCATGEPVYIVNASTGNVERDRRKEY